MFFVLIKIVHGKKLSGGVTDMSGKYEEDSLVKNTLVVQVRGKDVLSFVFGSPIH